MRGVGDAELFTPSEAMLVYNGLGVKLREAGASDDDIALWLYACVKAALGAETEVAFRTLCDGLGYDFRVNHETRKARIQRRRLQ